jgi:hypothetical protein
VLVVGTDAARFWTAASNDLNLMSFTAADNSSHPEMATLAGSDFWDESVNITVQAVMNLIWLSSTLSIGVAGLVAQVR